MNRSTFRILITVLISSGLFISICAADDLQPFGGFSWEDGLPNVVSKISKIEGLGKAELPLRGGEVLLLKDVKSKEVLSEKLKTMVTDEKSYTYSEIWDNNRNLSQCAEFVGKDGKKWRYPETLSIEVVCSPIVIKGVPFEITFDFDYSPGQALSKPDDVISFNDIGLSFPLILTKVTLHSDSPSLNQKKSEIDDVLAKKYGKLEPLFLKTLKEAGTVFIHDEKERKIQVTSSESDYTVQYSSSFEMSNLEKKYKEHLSNLEQGQIGTKPDASNKL